MDMDRFEAARHLGLADADVLGVEETEDGTKVTTRDGGDRIISDDGVFALTDHPAGAQLRRWGAGAADEGEEPAEDGSEPDEAHGQEPDGDEVPDGSADAVLGWVDDDPERAGRALDVEEQRDSPRSTLAAKLRKIAGR